MKTKIPNGKRDVKEPGARGAKIVTRTCPACETQFTGYACANPKYCSRSCAAKKRNLGKGKGWIRWKRGSPYKEFIINGEKKYEHTLIAEQVLGRLLKKDEVVHHIDMDTLNNKNNNLLICSPGYHRWLHSQYAKKFCEYFL